jgi:hypothetical protein
MYKIFTTCILLSLAPFSLFAENVTVFKELNKANWQIVHKSSEETKANNQAAKNAIDGNPNTIWHTEWKNKKPSHPHELVIDFGQSEHVEAITYLPRPQGDGDNGNVKAYQIFLGMDLNSLNLVASGEFQDSIEHNRKVIPVPSTEARYLRFVALSETNGKSYTSAAEIGILHFRLAEVNQQFSIRSQGGTPEIFLLGEEFWNSPWMPNLVHPDQTITLSPSNRIDIVILGDGYLPNEKEMFLWTAKNWYHRFLGLHPFQETKGAFRVRAIWTPSQTPSGQKDSFFDVGVDESGVSPIVSSTMSSKVYGILDEIDLNRKTSANQYTHAIVAMLVKPCVGFGCGISGRPMTIYSADKSKAISAALGDDALHEFEHAFANLSDEYIGTPNSIGKPDVKLPNPSAKEDYYFNVSNLSSTPNSKLLSWKHLAPGSELNPDPKSIIGRLWRGGGSEFGVWHSEPMCLMNGGHQNWDSQMVSRGAWLRDLSRLCFWCEEITAANIWYRTGMLGEFEEGESLISKWEKIRPQYNRALQVSERIAEQNAVYQKSSFVESPLSVNPALPVEATHFESEFKIIHVSTKRMIAESSGRMMILGFGIPGDKWVLEGDPNGFVHFKNTSKGCYLHMQDGTKKVSCTELHAGAWSGQFVITNVGDNRYSLWNRWTNQLLILGSNGQLEAGIEDVRNPKRGVWNFIKKEKK